MTFPKERLRRLRRTEATRLIGRETDVQARRLIAPLFVKEGIREPEPIESMPGQWQHTLDSLRKEAVDVLSRGVPSFILFGVPSLKDAAGSQADASSGISQLALQALRSEVGDEAVLIADLCLCEYTDHGHCGVLRGDSVDNDATLRRYSSIAAAQAESGADIVAPSGMMDGQVAAIRAALDDAQREDVAIMAYAAKFASALYGPFRDAAECEPKHGDRAAYQMDPPNRREAMREASLDEAEGADILMVKPALAYLDVIAAVRERTLLPVAAYHVSGEYSMVKAAARLGWIDENRVALEHLTSIRRAGADLIITYFAKELAEHLPR